MMKNRTVLQLGLCALLAGAVVAMPATAMADRNYNHSGRHYAKKQSDHHRHGGQEYRHYRQHRQHWKHGSAHYRHYRGQEIYSYPHFHYQPGISIWFRLN